MKTKLCIKCKEVKPATTEYYYRVKRLSSGFGTYCKDCIKRYEADNAERLHARQKINRIKNADKIKARQALWYKENKDTKRREYIEQNTEKIAEYKEKKKEQIRQRTRSYREKHKERDRRQLKLYREKNRETIRQRRSSPQGLEQSRKYCQKRRALKRSLEASFTPEQWESCLLHFVECCAYCGKPKKLEQDHVVPISKDGEYSKNNILPACVSCNRSKGDKDFFDWYRRSRVYSKRREQRIIKYLGYKEQNTQQLALTF